MSEEAFARIDKGIKRGPRKPVDRRPKADAKGLFVSNHTPEQRQAIISAAYEALAIGTPTDVIGASHGVPGSTLRYWLLEDTKADEARRMHIHKELARTLEDLRAADNPLALAQAREEFKAWGWVAERRLNAIWGQRNHLTVEEQPLSDVDRKLLGDASEMLSVFKAKAAEVLARQEKLINPSDSEVKDSE